MKRGRKARSMPRQVARPSKNDAAIEAHFDRLENRFDRLEDKLDEFKAEMSDWRSIFETKLTELNSNMKGVLERLSQHDFRFTEHNRRIEDLEKDKVKHDT